MTTPPNAADTTTEQTPTPGSEQALIRLLTQMEAMACSRDWSGWHHRTMREDDFTLIADDPDCISDLIAWRDAAVEQFRTALVTYIQRAESHMLGLPPLSGDLQFAFADVVAEFEPQADNADTPAPQPGPAKHLPRASRAALDIVRREAARPTHEDQPRKIYRDRSGDLWSGAPGEKTFLAVAPQFIWQGPTTRTLDDVEGLYGPLVELPAEDAAHHHAGLRALVERLGHGSGDRC